MERPVILIEGLAVGYAGRPVLSGVGFSVERACVLALLGPNGSGKSTLLKTVLGLLPPISGRVVFPDGPPVFGYVPQVPTLDPAYPLSAFDVALMGTFGRVRPGRAVPSSEHALVAECLAASGAAGFARKPFSELSGGQKQRVLIARALAAAPDVLVLDEPTAGVDHKTTHAIFDFIATLAGERQMAVMLATHDFGAVRRHASRVVWLRDGVASVGAAGDLPGPDRVVEMPETGAR